VKILIIGGSKFIGKAISESTVAAGQQRARVLFHQKLVSPNTPKYRTLPKSLEGVSRCLNRILTAFPSWPCAVPLTTAKKWCFKRLESGGGLGSK
jgi:hypothetical protein